MKVERSKPARRNQQTKAGLDVGSSLRLPKGSRVLLRSPNWLGDAIMSLPALQFLLAEGYRISILGPPKLGAFWSMVPGLDFIIFTDDNPAITAAEIRQHRFDAAVIYPNSLRTGLEVFLAGIPVRIGYKGHSRRWTLTCVAKQTPRQGWRHHAFHYLDLLDQAGLIRNLPEVPSFQSLPSPEHPSPHTGPYLALCPGAEYGPAKRWHPERFAAVAEKIAGEHSLDIVLLGSAGDRPACDEVESLLKKSTTRNLAGCTDMEAFIAWIAHARFVLCNDSGAMHLAAAFNRPGVAIFGSTEPAWTGPLSDSMKTVRHHVPCSPCFLRHCPLDFRCMNTLTTEMVLQSVNPQLATRTCPP